MHEKWNAKPKKNSMPKSGEKIYLEVFRVISFKHGYHFKGHSHKRIELNYVMQGNCIMMLENELVELNRNNSILILPDSEHDFYVNSKTGVKIVQIEFKINHDFIAALKERYDLELSFIHDLLALQKNFLKIPYNPEVKNCMERIILEKKMQRINYKPLIELYFLELIIILSRIINKQLNYQQQAENTYLRKALDIINSSLCSNISIKEIAIKCNVTPRYLHKLFKIHIQLSPKEYCNHLKLKKTFELLANQDLPIKEIAFSIGFSSPQYFSRMFKKRYGFSPGTYRKLFFESQS